MNLRRATTSDLGRLTALQRAAYARNQAILRVVPIPLQIDYGEVLATKEVWLAEQGGDLHGALVLEPATDHMLIWSISTDPDKQGGGLGGQLLDAAEARARDLGLTVLRLYTGTLLVHLVAWYARHGYRTERIEQLPDRSITHMVKVLPSAA